MFIAFVVSLRTLLPDAFYACGWKESIRFRTAAIRYDFTGTLCNEVHFVAEMVCLFETTALRHVGVS